MLVYTSKQAKEIAGYTKGGDNLKTYKQLTAEERMKTYENWQALCEADEDYTPFASFEEYDAEQEMLDLDFCADTLECLG